MGHLRVCTAAALGEARTLTLPGRVNGATPPCGSLEACCRSYDEGRSNCWRDSAGDVYGQPKQALMHGHSPYSADGIWTTNKLYRSNAAQQSGGALYCCQCGDALAHNSRGTACCTTGAVVAPLTRPATQLLLQRSHHKTLSGGTLWRQLAPTRPSAQDGEPVQVTDDVLQLILRVARLRVWHVVGVVGQWPTGEPEGRDGAAAGAAQGSHTAVW